MNPVVLRSVLKTFYTAEGDRATKEGLLMFLAPADEMEGTPSRGKASATPLYPEVDFYMYLLVLIHHRRRGGRGGAAVRHRDRRRGLRAEPAHAGPHLAQVHLLPDASSRDGGPAGRLPPGMSDMPTGLPIHQHQQYFPSISYHKNNTNDISLHFLTTKTTPTIFPFNILPQKQHQQYFPSISYHNANDISAQRYFPIYFPLNSD